MDTGLELIVGKSFQGETIQIDGIEFRDCRIADCVLVYSGGLPFLFERTPVARSYIDWQGPARATLDCLSAMYKLGMDQYVEAIFESIRNPRIASEN